MIDVRDRERQDAAETEADEQSGREGAPPRRQRRRLVSISVLPTLCTVGNGLSGFAALHFATREAAGEASMWHLTAAAWLIFVAMLFDMLDGRLARMTRTTTDFGGQLDSLCDAISFGAAPALLMLRTVQMTLRSGNLPRIEYLPELFTSFTLPDRVLWCIGGIYVACAVLRLARFNVESDEEDKDHLAFKGLPSPGAAAGVVILVLLLDHLTTIDRGILSHTATMITVVVTLPLLTLVSALLMVSEVEYPHVANRIHLSEKPFGTIAWMVVIGLFAVLDPILTGAVLVLAYILWSPVRAGWPRLRARRSAA